MRAAPWILPVVIAVAACAETGDRPTASSKPAPAAAQHEMKKIAPSASYPLTTCVVSGEDLGAMGDRIAYSYDGREVQFCCPDCIEKFEKDPATYLAKIPSAAK